MTETVNTSLRTCAVCNRLFSTNTEDDICIGCHLSAIDSRFLAAAASISAAKPTEKQSRTDSAMEASTNTFIGFWIGVGSNYAILPLFGYVPKFMDSLTIAALFTIISLLRSYILRRIFNGRSVWSAIKTKWN